MGTSQIYHVYSKTRTNDIFSCSSCGTILVQDWLVIPLVYTQVVAVACYGFFAICLVGRQCLDENQKVPGYEIDHYIPFFTVLQVQGVLEGRLR